MPRGVPKAGIRKTQRYLERTVHNTLFDDDIIEQIQETDQEIDTRIQERFEVLQYLASATVSGKSRALIVSGPPGLGKSYTIEQALQDLEPEQYTIIKGFVRATGLYKTLFQYRNPGSVVVFDDSDSIFMDEGSLSLLKAACDTTEQRILSWRAETNMRDEEEQLLPTNFEFNGSVIFITNYDFDKIIDQKQRYHEHMSAMVSRAFYLDLTMKTKRDFVIRIKQVVKSGMLSNSLSKNQIDMVVDYISTNQDKLRELSLRMAIKIGKLIEQYPDRWERIAKITLLKQ